MQAANISPTNKTGQSLTYYATALDAGCDRVAPAGTNDIARSRQNNTIDPSSRPTPRRRRRRLRPVGTRRAPARTRRGPSDSHRRTARLNQAYHAAADRPSDIVRAGRASCGHGRPAAPPGTSWRAAGGSIMADWRLAPTAAALHHAAAGSERRRRPRVRDTASRLRPYYGAVPRDPVLGARLTDGVTQHALP